MRRITSDVYRIFGDNSGEYTTQQTHEETPEADGEESGDPQYHLKIGKNKQITNLNINHYIRIQKSHSVSVQNMSRHTE